MSRRDESVSPISIVIPPYNTKPYINSAIESVLCQTIKEFEIIVVDDSPTDGREEVVRIVSDQRLRLIRQGNLGINAVRNSLWKKFLQSGAFGTFSESVMSDRPVRKKRLRLFQ